MKKILAPRSDLIVLVGLLILCIVPIGAGLWRLHQLAGSPAITADNARFVADPLPAVVHIVSASLFCVFGAFQVARVARRKSIGWHRYAGRAVAPLGIIAGLSGIWLTLAYWSITRDGPVLFSMRLAAGSAMAACILLGVVRVVRRDLAGHRAWMLRGYAIGLGAGTQVLTHLPFILLSHAPSQLETTVAMAAGWLINLAVVERHLRKRDVGSLQPLAPTMTSEPHQAGEEGVCLVVGDSLPVVDAAVQGGESKQYDGGYKAQRALEGDRRHTPA